MCAFYRPFHSQSYPFTTFSAGNSSSCSAGCHCQTVKFFPICGADGRNYLSPCHAGCMDKVPQVRNSVCVKFKTVIFDNLNFRLAIYA